MKLALIGYGGMGKTIHQIALERGHEVPVIIDPSDGAATPEGGQATASTLTADILEGVDVAIDFSCMDSVLENVAICKSAGVNLVMGTTGWYEQMEEVKKLIFAGTGAGDEGAETLPSVGFLWSSNFSIGVNLYFKMVEFGARLINKFDEYDIWGHEIHHANKADSPSGTAKSLEKILLGNIERKTAIVEDKLDRKREPHEIHFSSVRGGLVNFGHTIGFDSEADRILISHEARSRDGYALGAVKAAEWLKGKQGFFSMDDFLGDVFGK